jgi:carbonic anhydrase
MMSLTFSSVAGAGGAVDESAGGDQVLHPTQQSPINLPATPPSRSQHEIEIEYSDTAEHLIHRDHTIEMEYDPGSKVEFDGRQYQLEQFHFHTPSEHLVAQRRFPVELHLVHHSKDGQALVLGILFEIGPPSAFIEQILRDAPRGIGRIDLESHLDVSKLLPDEKHFYAYVGSLTTAPYTEGIQWLILSEHPSVSPEQVVRLLVLEGGNARDAQPIGDRSIEGS